MSQTKQQSSYFELWLTASILVISSVWFGGNGQKPMFIVTILSIILVTTMLWTRPINGAMAWPVRIWLFLCFLAVGLYAIPLSEELWRQLPGREGYFITAQLLSLEPLKTISLVPAQTWQSLLAMISPFAVFWACTRMDDRAVKTLIWVVLVLACCQALLGIVQYATQDPFYLLGMKAHGHSAQGTYANRDHFASLMVMALPLSIAMLMYKQGRKIQTQSLVERFSINIIPISVIVIIFLGGLLSASRAGITLLLTGFLISILSMIRYASGKKSTRLLFGILIFSGAIAVVIGLIPVLNRFLALDPREDGRWEIFENTLLIIHNFWPFGGGLGTFGEIYRSFQPLGQNGFINHAHNEYLEALFEMGVIGGILFSALMMFWGYSICQSWNDVKIIRRMSIIVIFLTFLHASVDFIMHIQSIFIMLCLNFSFFVKKYVTRKCF